MGRKVVGKDERLGYISKDCNGNLIKVIEYLEYKRVKVQWETGETSWTNWHHVVEGSIKRPEVRLGTTHKDVGGEEFKVIEYNSSSDVTVSWEDGVTKKTSWGSIIKGIEKPVNFNSRIGLRFENKAGDKYTIVEWIDSNNVVVEWDLIGNRSTHQWSHVSRSNVRNPKRSVYGVGYASSRFYNDTNVYNAWRRMLCRAYDKGFHKRQPSYKDVEVSQELHDYAHFYKVYTSLVGYGERGFSIDKDILSHYYGLDPVYSEKTISMVPRRLNSLAIRHSDGAGVRKGDTTGSRYYVEVCDKYIGSYQSREDANNAYLAHKQLMIDEIVKDHHDKLDPRVIEALQNWCRVV